jgi:hypothetical protein
VNLSFEGVEKMISSLRAVLKGDLKNFVRRKSNESFSFG